MRCTTARRVGITKRRITFKPREFAKEAQEHFIELQTALVAQDKAALQPLVTENAYLSLASEFRNRHTWSFVEETDRPRVVHLRTFAISEKNNYFAQALVRIASRQIMAQFE